MASGGHVCGWHAKKTCNCEKLSLEACKGTIARNKDTVARFKLAIVRNKFRITVPF